jgi:hypothetical protein
VADLGTSSPSSILAPPPTGGDPLADDMKSLRAQQTQLQSDSDKVEGDRDQALQATEKRRDDLIMRPPQLQQTPPPKPEATNPTKAWGSMAMIMAGLGALMTRTPLTTALNAAAGVLHAYQKGDVDDFNAKFKAWQVANDNAKELWEFQQKQYDAILGQLDRSENLTREEARDHIQEIRGKLTAVAAAMHDDQMAQALRQNDMHFVQTLQDNRQRIGDAYAEHGLELEKTAAVNQEMNQFRLDHPKATPDEVTNKLAATMLKFSPTQHISQQQQVATEQRIQGQWKTDPTFKAYSAANQYLRTMQTIDTGQPQSVAGVAAQTGFVDQFTQAMNGGRAIRGFQQKLLTDHAGIWNNLEIAANQLKRPQGGGMLSAEMVSDMMTLAKEYAAEIDAPMRDAVYRTKQRAFLQGANPANVTPPDYSPTATYKMTGMWVPGATPSEHVIDALESGKVSEADFDKKFGANAAIVALAMRRKERESAAAAEGATDGGEQ